MIVSHDLTILAMIANASIVVKAVMAVLVLASLFSWTYIFMKVFALRRAQRQAEEFEREFWSGSDLVGLYQRAAGGRYVAAGMERIFEAGFKEFLKLKGRAGADVTALMDGTRRAMKATLQREVDALESLGKVRCVFVQEIRREADLLLRAKVTVACVTGEHFKPAEIPEALRRKMQASL